MTQPLDIALNALVLTELRGFLRYLLTGETGHGRLPLMQRAPSVSVTEAGRRTAPPKLTSRRSVVR